MTRILIYTATLFMTMTANAQTHYNLLVGTYTKDCKSDGIYIYDFDTQTGDFIPKGLSDKVINPSFLTVSPDGSKIYSVNENGEHSSVSSFNFDAKKGTIHLINTQDSQGADPCHIINNEKHVVVANYSGGSIAVLDKNADGSLNAAKQTVKHQGHSANKTRQEKPHVHQINFSPDKKYVFANDLGTDRIYIYSYTPDGSEVLKLKDTIATKTGGGPRHLTFAPNGKFVYLLQELDGTLTAFSLGDGTLRRIQETTIVSADFPGQTSAADIHISADGKFLYATNRGDANTISIFSIDSKGKLSHKETVSTMGKGPRNFAIDPSGNFVLVAHEKSNDIVIFRRDKVTGLLTNTGKKMQLCAPVCLVFAQ